MGDPHMRLSLSKARVTKTILRTAKGPVEILKDPQTGISLSIPRGKTPGGVIETVFDRKRFCARSTERIIDIPSREVPGKIVRQLFCCLKGKKLARMQNARTCRRGFFVQAFFEHPQELSDQLRQDFLTGHLQDRRRRILDVIKKAGLR